MSIHPQENRPERPQHQSGAAQRPATPQRRGRHPRAGTRPAPRPAAGTERSLVAEPDLDSDDDLTLPTYGMRFDHEASPASGDVPRKKYA